MDFEKICRCCLNQKREIKNMYSSVEVDGKQEIISELFKSCLNVEMNAEDGLPQNICNFCITTLQMSLSFKRVLENSKNVLLQYLENSEVMPDDAQTNIDFICSSIEIADMKAYCPQIENNPIKDEKFQQSYVPNTHIYIPPKKRKKDCSGELDKCYFCTVCNLSFSEPFKLYKHCTSQHTQTQVSGRSCDYCNERFNDFKLLLVHRRKHITPYVCSVCWKGYLVESDLKEHLMNSCQTKTQSEETESVDSAPKRIMCHICGKSYPVGYIKIHLLIHSEGNIQCKYCGKTFKQPGSLSSHILWNHKKERVHNCDYCDLVFITSSAKTRHIRKIHNKEKKISCNLCDKKFFCSSELKRHTLTHTGIKNYICDNCDKAYQTRYGLNVHLKSHHVQ